MMEQTQSSWAEVVRFGTTNAMFGLSQMIGQEIDVTSFDLTRVPVSHIRDIMGGPEAIAVGIYLTVEGTADGHIMLMYEPKTAAAFVDLLMGAPPGTTGELDEMARSALGEMGNVIGSRFLNALADSTGLKLRPSPPTVMIDMAGALLDVVASSLLLNQDETYLAETTFSTADRDISGIFFVMPSESLREALMLETESAA